MARKKVLIVDDEAGFTKMVKLTLENTGRYIVIEENVGTETIRTAWNCRPDIIFLDVVMPDIDGGDVASRLKNDPRLKDVPVVFLTAIVSSDEALTKDKIGGFPFLSKPVSLDALEKCIEEHLGGH